MNKCPKCGATLRQGLKYTFVCGTSELTVGGYDDGKECLRRQLSSANAKIAEMARLADETLAAVEAIAGVGGWRPIETAPMDGRAVLLHNNLAPGNPSGRMESCEGYNTVVGEWWGGEDTPGKWMCYMDAIEDPRCPFDPTHWMPLPQPPKEADDDDA